MEILPEEIIEMVVQYLTPKDLSRCCAVSYKWRERFNCDMCWRPFCDQELCEYLQVTPCAVKPKFVSPIMKASRLSDVCDWRLKFMRQTHFYNNWRQSRYTKKPLNFPNESDPYWNSSEKKITFYNDSILILWGSNTIKVISVFNNTPYVVANLRLLNSFEVIYLTVIEDKVVVCQEYDVQIFKPSSVSMKEWPMVQNFKMYVKDSVYLRNCVYFVAKNFLFTSFKDLMVWDMETGVLLKEEVPPDWNFTCAESFQSLTSLIAFKVVLNFWKASIIVYNLLELKCTPFKTQLESYDQVCGCVFYNQYLVISVAVGFEYRIEVYNYENSELVTKINYDGSYTCNLGYQLHLINNEIMCFSRCKMEKLNLKSGFLTFFREFEGNSNFCFVCDKYIIANYWHDNCNGIQIVFQGQGFLKKTQSIKLFTKDLEGFEIAKSNSHCAKMVTRSFNLSTGKLDYFLVCVW